MAHHGRSGKNPIPPANAARPGGAKGRGRAARTTKADPNAGPVAREGNVLQERLTEANRPMTAGVKKRGDRRDMQPDPGIRAQRGNRGLRTDRNPTSTAGRRNNRVPNEGG
jgi:hypothetical protein